MPRLIVTRDVLDMLSPTPEEFQKHAVAFVKMAAESLHPEYGYAHLTRDLARALVPLIDAGLRAQENPNA